MLKCEMCDKVFSASCEITESQIASGRMIAKPQRYKKLRNAGDDVESEVADDVAENMDLTPQITITS